MGMKTLMVFQLTLFRYYYVMNIISVIYHSIKK